MPDGKDKNSKGVFDDKSSYVPPQVESKGNADAQILAKAFEEFSRHGLTLSDREKIEKLDDILKDADIVISRDGSKATIAQEDGATFTVMSKDKGRGR